jgi:hypothetical protein
MKNLLIAFILLISFSAFSQVEKKILGFPEDKVNHFTVGYMSGFVSNAVTYKILSEHTKLNLFACKFISTSVGVGSGFLLGHLKEKYDSNHGGFYNKKDLKATGYGSIAGSFTITIIIWRMKPENRFTMQEFYDDDL